MTGPCPAPHPPTGRRARSTRRGWPRPVVRRRPRSRSESARRRPAETGRSRSHRLRSGPRGTPATGAARRPRRRPGLRRAKARCRRGRSGSRTPFRPRPGPRSKPHGSTSAASVWPGPPRPDPCPTPRRRPRRSVGRSVRRGRWARRSPRLRPSRPGSRRRRRATCCRGGLDRPGRRHGPARRRRRRRSDARAAARPRR